VAVERVKTGGNWNCVVGLEENAEAIYNYFGQDFITPRK